MHLVTIRLNLMCSNYRQIVVFLKQAFGGLKSKLDRTVAVTVVYKNNSVCVLVVSWVSPKQVAIKRYVLNLTIEAL